MDKSERSALVVQAATVMLECYGMQAIWDLHLAASMLRQKGHLGAADVTMAIADETERVWLHLQGDDAAVKAGLTPTPLANSQD